MVNGEILFVIVVFMLMRELLYLFSCVIDVYKVVVV